MNPAVTLAMALYRKFPLRKLPVYWLAQFLGAWIGAALIWGTYQNAIRSFEGGSRLTVPPATNATAGIFATYPAPFMTKAGMFMSEILGTGLLVFLIFAITDVHNPMNMGRYAPVGLFFIFWGITACFGFETGFAVNPARDLAPRIMTSMVGYPRQVWTARSNYFLVPLFAPFIGAIFGGFVYDSMLYKGRDSPVSGLVRKIFGGRRRNATGMV